MKKIILLFYLFAFFSYVSSAQGVASSAVENVDLYTGNMSYSVPFFSVTGPHGESYPIGINYQSGIRLKQESSEIGLGWNINFPEISRSVKGVPDDWKGVVTTSKNFIKQEGGTYTLQSPDVRVKHYGPIYYKDIYSDADVDKEMDITAQVLNDGSMFFFPAYDKYFVSSPFLSGEIGPHLFEYGSLHFKQSPPSYDLKYEYTNPYNSQFTVKPQFRFTTDKSSNVTYDIGTGIDLVENSTYSFFKWDPINGDYNTLTTTENYKKLKNPNTIKFPSGNINLVQNRVKDGKYIVYFTNAEINSATTAQLSEKGFIDYRIPGASRRDPSIFPADGIGAFQITDESGMVYHFSLPVYTISEAFKSFVLSGVETDPYGLISPKHAYQHNQKTANSWKLVAITGPDYKDVNNNLIVDEGDDGYWIALDYALWNEAGHYHTFNYPKAGVTEELESDRKVDQSFNFLLNETTDAIRYGMKSTVTTEVYSLNKIRTATQTALFIKDIKKDARYDGLDGNTLPMFYILSVLLFDNTQNPYSYFTGTTLSGLPNINESSIFFYGDYSSNKASIDAMTLQSVHLNQDYSLCKKFISNQNVTITTPASTKIDYCTIYPDFNIHDYPPNADINFGYSIADHNQTGKLTLNTIQTALLRGNSISGPITFDYNDFHNFQYSEKIAKEDYWGYYLHNTTSLTPFESRFQNTTTSQYMDAWSLTKIVNPLGASIIYEYEADEYQGGARHVAPSGITNAGYVKGGGIRVKSVQVINGNSLDIGASGDNKNYKVIFTYKKGNLLYEPSPFSIKTKTLASNTTATYYYGEHATDISYPEYEIIFDGYEFNRYNASQFIPSNEVGYELVSVEDRGIDGTRFLGKSSYKFGNYSTYYSSTLQSSYKLERVNCTSEVVPGYWAPELHRVLSVSNNEGLRGKLLQTEMYDANNQLVASTKYTYTPISRIQECFHNAYSIGWVDIGPHVFKIPIGKIFTNCNRYAYNDVNTDCENGYKVINAFVQQCGIPAGSRTIIQDAYTHNYTHYILSSITEEKDGLKISKMFEEYNPLLGTYTTSTENDGHIKSTTSRLYAFSTLTHSLLGAKSVNPTNLNQLNFISKVTHTPGIQTTSTLYSTLQKRYFNTGSSIFTTEPINNIWHQQSSTVYSLDNTPKEVSFLTLVNPYKYPCEMRSANNEYSSIKYGYEDRYKIATLNGGRYGEFTYSGFEDPLVGGNRFTSTEIEVLVNATQILDVLSSGIQAHTGTKLLQLNPTQEGIKYEIPINSTGTPSQTEIEKEKYYEAMVWVRNATGIGTEYPLLSAKSISSSGTETVIATTSTPITTCGSWSLLKINFKIANSNTDPKCVVQVNGADGATTYIDDFRFAPEVSSMSAYVYDPFSHQITYTLDDHNMYTRIEYDPAGMQKSIYVETPQGEKLVKSNLFNIVR